MSGTAKYVIPTSSLLLYLPAYVSYKGFIETHKFLDMVLRQDE